MKKLFIIVLFLAGWNNLKAQNINVTPNNPTESSSIVVTTVYGCNIFTENMSHSINGFVVEFEIEVDTINNHPPCLADPPPPISYTYALGQLPAGDYEFIFNTTDLVDMSVSQRSVFVTVGPAPTPVPLNSSLLILLVLAVVGLYYFKKESH